MPRTTTNSPGSHALITFASRPQNSRLLAVSPGGRTLAVWAGQALRLWHAGEASPRTANLLAGRPGVAPLSLSFSLDGQALAAGLSDRTAWLWDVSAKGPGLRAALSGHDGPVAAVYLGHGPVAREAAVSDEAEDVPTDEPTGQGDGEFGLWADGAGPAGASGGGAALETAAKFHRPLEGVDAAAAA